MKDIKVVESGSRKVQERENSRFTQSPNEVPETAIRDDRREFNVISLPVSLDEINLSPAEFRVYVHLVYRALRGESLPYTSKIAERCKISVDEVNASISGLAALRLIYRVTRETCPNIYILTAESQWKHASETSKDTSINVIAESSKGQPSAPTDSSLCYLKSSDLSEQTPTAATLTPLQQKAERITEQLQSLHWDTCKVYFSKSNVYTYAKLALDDGHSEASIITAYRCSLSHCHRFITDEMDSGKRLRHEKASPALTIWLSNQRLKDDGKTPKQRWDEIVARSKAAEERRIKDSLKQVTGDSQTNPNK